MKAKQFQDHACDDVAAAYKNAARDLESTLRVWGSDLLTIAEASRETGFSEEHLRRLVREGKLDAERGNGNRGRIRLRRAKLPRRTATQQTEKGDSTPSSTYDPEEDARDIAERLGR